MLPPSCRPQLGQMLEDRGPGGAAIAWEGPEQPPSQHTDVSFLILSTKSQQSGVAKVLGHTDPSVSLLSGYSFQNQPSERAMFSIKKKV